MFSNIDTKFTRQCSCPKQGPEITVFNDKTTLSERDAFMFYFNLSSIA